MLGHWTFLFYRCECEVFVWILQHIVEDTRWQGALGNLSEITHRIGVLSFSLNHSRSLLFNLNTRAVPMLKHQNKRETSRLHMFTKFIFLEGKWKMSFLYVLKLIFLQPRLNVCDFFCYATSHAQRLEEFIAFTECFRWKILKILTSFDVRISRFHLTAETVNLKLLRVIIKPPRTSSHSTTQTRWVNSAQLGNETAINGAD